MVDFLKPSQINYRQAAFDLLVLVDEGLNKKTPDQVIAAAQVYATLSVAEAIWEASQR